MQLVHQGKGNTYQDVSLVQNDKWWGEVVFLQSALTWRIFVSFRAFHGYLASFPSRMLENPLTRTKTAMLISFPVSVHWELDSHTFRLLDYSSFHSFNIPFPWADDYNRVELSDINGDPGSNYINASYIDVSKKCIMARFYSFTIFIFLVSIHSIQLHLCHGRFLCF